MTSFVKICGLRTAHALTAALEAGADAVGFVRFPPSPRHVGLGAARELSEQARGRAIRTLLVVDPADDDLDAALWAIAPDLLQLHGTETPERAAALRARTGLPVMKALPIGTAADLAAIDRYRGAADRILLDARPPGGAARPGGNGQAFDWALLEGVRHDPDLPIVLSGGLTPGNVAEAIATSGLAAVDVSSGVERAPGEKDAALIAAFVAAAREAAGGIKPSPPHSLASDSQRRHPEEQANPASRRTHNGRACFETRPAAAPQHDAGRGASGEYRAYDGQHR